MATAAVLTTTTTKKKVATKPRFKNAVKNILTILAHATAEEIKDGQDWYTNAKTFASEQAAIYGVSLEIVAGIISALSPATNWERNKFEAQQVLKGNRSFKYATYSTNVDKAFLIRNAGLHVDVASFFPSNKTYNFYHNIVNPSDKMFVTIDRHALSIANGSVREDKTVTNVEYKELAIAYTKAAKKLGLLPCEIQAISWEIWRRAKGYKAKFTVADLANVRATAN